MGYYLGLPLMILVVALQSSVMPFFRWYSGQPNLVLLLVVVWAVYASLNEGLFWAIVGGLAQDVMSVLPLGASILPLVLMVFFIAWIRGQVYNVNFIFVLGFIGVGTFLQQVISLIVLTQIGFGSDFIVYVRYVSLPTLAYHMVLGLPLYWVVGWLYSRLPRAGFQYDVR